MGCRFSTRNGPTPAPALLPGSAVQAIHGPIHTHKSQFARHLYIHVHMHVVHILRILEDTDVHTHICTSYVYKYAWRICKFMYLFAISRHQTVISIKTPTTGHPAAPSSAPLLSVPLESFVPHAIGNLSSHELSTINYGFWPCCSPGSIPEPLALPLKCSEYTLGHWHTRTPGHPYIRTPGPRPQKRPFEADPGCGPASQSVYVN